MSDEYTEHQPVYAVDETGAIAVTVANEYVDVYLPESVRGCKNGMVQVQTYPLINYDPDKSCEAFCFTHDAADAAAPGICVFPVGKPLALGILPGGKIGAVKAAVSGKRIVIDPFK